MLLSLRALLPSPAPPGLSLLLVLEGRVSLHTPSRRRREMGPWGAGRGQAGLLDRGGWISRLEDKGAAEVSVAVAVAMAGQAGAAGVPGLEGRDPLQGRE